MNVETGPVDAIVLAQPIYSGEQQISSFLVAQKYRSALPLHIVDQLVTYSTDPSDVGIQGYTRDPERFRDRDAVSNWLNKGRAIYALMDPTGEDLYGISWIGREPLPREGFTFSEEVDGKYGYTWARRLYGEARGRRLSRLQTQILLEDFFMSHEYDPCAPDSGVWETVSPENIGVIKVEQSLGFRKIGEGINGDKIIMAATFEHLASNLILNP